MLNVILLQICKKICEICVICGFLCIFAQDMLQPLAERLRPRTLDDYIGQEHLVGEGAVLRKMIDAGRISSFILWGSSPTNWKRPSIRSLP